MQPLISVAIDDQAPQAIKGMTFVSSDVMTLPLGESNTILAMASDGTMLAVMYLSLQELLHHLRQDLLMPMMITLHDRSSWAYLLLEGQMRPTGSGKTEVNGNTTGYEWSAVQGALLSVQELGVGVLTVQSPAYLADTIYRLAKRDRTTSRIRPPREALFVTPAEDLLMALPGIGEERCETLLRHCGTAAWALDALTHPAVDPPGISQGIKSKVRTALGLPEGVYLTQVTYIEDPDEYDRPFRPDHHTSTIGAGTAGVAA